MQYSRRFLLYDIKFERDYLQLSSDKVGLLFCGFSDKIWILAFISAARIIREIINHLWKNSIIKK
jgi:hypothetical protein